MIKKAGLLALIALLCLTLISPIITHAQNELIILDNSAEAEFPYALDFSLSAASDVDITDIRLCYTIDRAGFADVTSEVIIDFVPDTSVDVEWTWDMRRTGGLPPGTVIEYWWLVEDTSGDTITTDPVSLQFNDTRYSWDSLTEGEITVYWYEGDDAFAQELMDTTHQALSTLAQDTGAYLEKPVKLYIYANTADLQGAMIYPQEWTGGAAFTRYGIIVIGIPTYNLQWGKRAITHELTHLVIHQMTLNPYNEIPTWLDEGLAMHTEGLLGPEYTFYLNKAITEDKLISARSLSSPFSTESDLAYLSYAESYSLVEFLISQYGHDKMLELLLTFKEGSSYDGALEAVYGFDTYELDSLWRDYVNAHSRMVEAGG